MCDIVSVQHRMLFSILTPSVRLSFLTHCDPRVMCMGGRAGVTITRFSNNCNNKYRNYISPRLLYRLRLNGFVYYVAVFSKRFLPLIPSINSAIEDT